MTNYEAVIGLETHIQLNTNTKIFCSCKADSWGEEPNTNVCPVCSGSPGVLPVLNKAVIEKAVVLAKAMNAEIPEVSYFDRKNYFYPDLPKGYQITQYDQSVSKGGYLDLKMDGYTRRVHIHKAHVEEDAGKTKNETDRRLIDFNRCGVPLVEMVTMPDLRTADEAAEYLIRLRQLLRWLGISEGNMERAHLRCDANVSIRPEGSTELFTKTEIKNVNSIEAVRTAIEKEIKRQVKEVSVGNEIKPWTLQWDDTTQTLKKMRSKETEADYRYFREPDLLKVEMTEAWKQEILKDFPELPIARMERFIEEYKLPEYDANILTTEKDISDFFEAAVKAYQSDPKRVSNWMMNEVLRLINDEGISTSELTITPNHLAEIIKLVDDKKVNTSTGKSLVEKVQKTGKLPSSIVDEEGLAQVSDEGAIKAICEEVLNANQDKVAAYQAGKLGLIGFFVGQVMQKSRGKANPQQTKALLESLLNE